MRLVTLDMKNMIRSVALVMLVTTKTPARPVKDVQQASFRTSLVQWNVLPAMRAPFPTPRAAKSAWVAHPDNPRLTQGSPPVPTAPQKRTTLRVIRRLAASVLTVPIIQVRETPKSVNNVQLVNIISVHTTVQTVPLEDIRVNPATVNAPPVLGAGMPMVMVPKAVSSVQRVRWTMLRVPRVRIVELGHFKTKRSVKPVRLAHSKAELVKISVQYIHSVLLVPNKT